MERFEIEYYYLATGMEGIADTYPKKIIEAESQEEAIYKYHTSNGIKFGSFEDFIELPKHVRYWGITCKPFEIKEMEYKVFNSYGAFYLESKRKKLSYDEVKKLVVVTSKGDEGYIRKVGTNSVQEHGYSAQEDIYKLITLDYKVISIPKRINIK